MNADEITITRVRPLHPVAIAGLAMALLAGLLVLVSGPGSRWGYWHFGTGFTLMRWGAYLALAALVVSAVGALLAALSRRHRGALVGVAGMLVALVAVAPPYLGLRRAQSVPPIHDITTDTENPPVFVAVVPLRADARNPVEYAGDSVAALQREAYPDVQPLMLPMTPDSAFTVARTAAERMGWEIVDVNREEGRIEATDRTFWYGFLDDVVIRVTPASGIARVDVRSLSRVGGSDVGANAARIRRYLAELREVAGVR